ncbi:MAG: hypothetical protein KC468_31240 [Myxococcales bacterium]|nr:hypothetical protein [Myxococcales bacterium]
MNVDELRRARLWQVGQLVHVWRPYVGDYEPVVLTLAGAEQLYAQLRGTHPDLALSIVRRAPTTETVYVMRSTGATIPDGDRDTRLRHRLSKLTRECTHRGLHVSVARWLPLDPLERSREFESVGVGGL